MRTYGLGMSVPLEALPNLEHPSVPEGSADAPLLAPTKLLDFRHPAIERWVRERGLTNLEMGPGERISVIYRFVRDEIAFGYNASDDLSASQVLAEGYGQCNTKTTLLMALLRAAGIPCRFHGATVEKALQRGVVPELVYSLAPPSILHGYAEVWFEGAFRALEGVILDAAYLDGLRRAFPVEGAFLGYGAGTCSLASPPNDWRGEDTFIQRTGIDADFGTYESPDGFYAAHGTNLRGPKAWLYRAVVRHAMNRRVARIRAGHLRL